MKSIRAILIILIIIILSQVAFGSISYIWVASGDSFNVDGLSYSLYIQDTGSTQKILLKNMVTPDKSEIVSVGNCIKTDYKNVCFIEMNYSLDRYGVKNYRVLVGLEEIFIGMNGSIANTNITAYVLDTKEIQINLEPQGEMDFANFTLALPKELEISNENGCNIKIEDNQTVIYSNQNNPKYNESCIFDITSKEPFSADISGKIVSKYKDKEKITYLLPVKINFIVPYTYTYVIESINLSKQFKMNFTFQNPTEKEIIFNNLAFNVPTSIYSPDAHSISELGSKYYALQKKFNIKPNESENITLNLMLYNEGNYTILLLPEYEYDGNIFNKKHLDTISLKYGNTTTSTELSTLCTNESIVFNSTYNSSTIYYPGDEIDFNIYGQSNISGNIKNVTVDLYDNGKKIATRFIDVVQTQDKFLVSRMYKTIPDFESNLNYEARFTFKCYSAVLKSYNVFSGKYNLNVVVDKNTSIDVQKEMPGTISKGEKIKVTVNVSNTKERFIRNISLKEVIPSDFNTEGITERTISLGNSTEEAYSYYLEYLGNQEKDYTIKTLVSYNIDNKITTKEIEKMLSIVKQNASNKTESTFSVNPAYINEPLEITYQIKNIAEEEIKNIEFKIKDDENYDVEVNNDYFISSLTPNQSVSKKFWIIPKKENISLLTTIEFEGRLKSDDRNISVNVKRTNIAIPKYGLSVFKLLNGSSNLTANITNDYDNNVTIYIFGKESIVAPDANEIVTTTSSEEEIPNLIYYVFNTSYATLPYSKSFSVEQPVIVPINVTENKPSENIEIPVPPQNDTKQITLEKVKPLSQLQIISYVSVIAVIIFGIIFGIINLKNKAASSNNRKKNSDNNSPSANYNNNSANNDNKTNSSIDKQKNIDSLSTTDDQKEIPTLDVFNFNEFDKLKEKVDSTDKNKK